MTCIKSFRTNNPHKILRALFNEQRKVDSNPQEDADFVKLRSTELFAAAGIPITNTAKYSIVTKLTVGGLLSVHSDPNHKQAMRYALTPQGMRCQQCHSYQEGIEPMPKGFRCGAIS